MPLWVVVDDAAVDWRVPPWVIEERQASHGDAWAWLLRHRALTQARREGEASNG